MDCVRCDADTDHNRVAVDQPTGDITGTICVECGSEILSVVDNPATLTMATCLVCGDSSDILFPKWETIVETEAGSKMIEYTIELTTPALCDSCLSANRPTM